MESKKLTDEERAELNQRTAMINFYQTTLNLLVSEKNLFVRHLLESKDLDTSKQYEISEDGVLSEVT